MPMPHRTFAQVAKRRLVGKEGSERVRTIRALMDELPDYRNGPYADLRKWLQEELDRTRVRAKVVHRDSISVRREGAAQVALVGAPNAGKSSLLQALSNIQIKTGRAELAAAGIEKPTIVAATKVDDAPPGSFEALARAYPELEVLRVSVL